MYNPKNKKSFFRHDVSFFSKVKAGMIKRRVSVKSGLCLAVAGMICLIAVSGAEAGVKGVSPEDACRLLDDIGLPTLGWNTYPDNESKCASRSVQIGSGNPFKNSLAFYADGTGQTVEQLRLVVSVLNSEEAAKAHDVLKTAAQHLLVKLTGKDAPEKILTAITAGGNASARTGSFTVDVIRREWTMNTDWATIQCHEIAVLIK